MFRLFILGSFFLLGCTSVTKEADSVVNIGEDVKLQLPAPKEILPDIELVQLLSFEHGSHKNTIQTVLTCKDNRLILVGLMPLGAEAFRVEYSKGEMKASGLMTGQQKFDLKMALADIVLVYAKKEDLNLWLSQGSRVVDDKNRRTILFREKPIIQIAYDKVDKFSGTINYMHLTRNYQIHIKPVSQ